MKEYFESKVKVDENEDPSSNSRVIKTDQGLEFVSAIRKEKEERKGELKDTPQKDSSCTEGALSKPASAAKEATLVV